MQYRQDIVMLLQVSAVNSKQ